MKKFFGKMFAPKTAAFVAAAMICVLVSALSLQVYSTAPQQNQTADVIDTNRVYDSGESIQWHLADNEYKIQLSDGGGRTINIVIANQDNPAQSGLSLAEDDLMLAFGYSEATTLNNDDADAVKAKLETEFAEQTEPANNEITIEVYGSSLFWDNLVEDINNFDLYNNDMHKVHTANYFSGFRGQIVLHISGNGRSGSFGRIMIITESSRGSTTTLLHEHGHYLQYQQLGLLRYFFGIAIPSWRHMPKDYYSQPWEVTADIMAEVPFVRYSPGADVVGWDYFDAILNNPLDVVVGNCFAYYWD